jgi:hypothetical protein
MTTIIRQLFADLPHIGFMEGESLTKQTGYALIPRNQFVQKFYRSKAIEVKKGKKTVTETQVYPPKKPGTSNLLCSGERQLVAEWMNAAW